MLLALLGGACDDDLEPPAATAADVASAAAVDHVATVLAQAGRAPARLPGAVRFDCGPTDEVLGRQLTTDAIHLEVAFSQVAPVVAEDGRELSAAPQDPNAGAPAYIDRSETSGDDWTVRWGESMTTETADGDLGTTVTFIDGGPVAAEDLGRWQQDDTVVDVFHCG